MLRARSSRGVSSRTSLSWFSDPWIISHIITCRKAHTTRHSCIRTACFELGGKEERFFVSLPCLTAGTRIHHRPHDERNLARVQPGHNGGQVLRPQCHAWLQRACGPRQESLPDLRKGHVFLTWLFAFNTVNGLCLAYVPMDMCSAEHGASIFGFVGMMMRHRSLSCHSPPTFSNDISDRGQFLLQISLFCALRRIEITLSQGTRRLLISEVEHSYVFRLFTGPAAIYASSFVGH
ncbi:hypothetical protein B0T24DRAFT_635267 [Lasiosphaeria ovina]|uniref:Uncharacterized protein n=1 Tax=Lasiosphaeria ovina TaxID=92902 RepID=A0AAE0JZJ0_9PEZI|nr:hypothetical protein B0T24DRAFT_635267 [Lasiosphaeria ovina]